MAAGYARKTGPAALGVQASVLGAQIRLGQIRRPVRCVLARQTGAVALADHGLGQGRQQPVAEKPAGHAAGARRQRRRDRPGALGRRCAGATAPAKAAWKAPRAPTISPRSISARWPTPTQIEAGPCGRGAAGKDHAHAADPARPGAAARLPARSAPNHPRQYQPWRRADHAWSNASARKSRCGW